MAHEAKEGSDGFLLTLQSPLITGRWLLVSAETVETLFWLLSGDRSWRAVLVLLALFLYNALSLVLVHRTPIRRVPVAGLLALDLLFVAAAAIHTGGSDSPFLGQYYLIIFAGALFYGLAGGLAVGTLSALITGLIAIHHSPNRSSMWVDLRDLEPYFLIAGAFTGYLVSRLRTAYQRYQRRELQAQMARREMELARSMQQAALPAAPPPVRGLDIAARLQFAREVGGDLYTFLTSGARVGLVIGDVSGKGIPAALVATTLSHLLPWLQLMDDPHRALCFLNRDLDERLPDEAFVTLALAVVDTQTGQLTVWAAGHPPALVWRARGGCVLEAQVRNPLLGLLPDWNGQPEAWPFEPGDVVVLYSDGLVEVRDVEGEPFETFRAARVVEQNAHRTADAIADALVAAAIAWGTLSDDLTVLVCKRMPGDQEAPEAGTGSPGSFVK